ncbi:MAG: FAD-binding protein [Proteobacteria bacterium]|nr:FAD-binding protein [Pseudomonadota bacterium]
MYRSEILRKLRLALPEHCVISDPARMKPYETDGLTALKQTPWLVVLPENEAQVEAVVRICHAGQVPVVPRGAGTGLSGGARPVSDGVVLGLSRMKKVLDIDVANCTARVEPGVRNIVISQQAARHGLYYAPDPSSQIACSIGGNVAENSGGVHCLKYGLTVNNVLGVRALTMRGEWLNIGGQALDQDGYDLLSLMCGSEGMLAIVTEVTVRLLPDPPARRLLQAAFSDVASAAASVAGIISAGIIPAGLEMMDRLAIQAAEDFVHAGYPRDAAAILLCEIDGVETALAEDEQMIRSIMRECGATDVRTAVDAAEQANMWKGRKAAFPAVGRISPDYYCMDGTIPRRHLAQVLAEINRLSEEYGLSVANVFHAGDGNLHPLILYDANKPGELARTEEMGGRILECCVVFGGTVTGEHGVGVEKLNQMCAQFSAHELQQFERLKEAFDPDRLLNPGKAIPTLTRCAEVGGMHVHGADIPFKHLDRF